jgi:hypothetical protein
MLCDWYSSCRIFNLLFVVALGRLQRRACGAVRRVDLVVCASFPIKKETGTTLRLFGPDFPTPFTPALVVIAQADVAIMRYR